MLGSLRGTVSRVWLDRVLLDVAGVGFLAFATPRLLGELRPGAQAQVSVSLVVREDALTLYAFADDEEREVFDTVRSISGVGPKIALSLLAVHSAAEVKRAIAEGDLKAIQRVPGIGSKTAQRFLLELGGKLVPTETASGSGFLADPNRDQVVAALVGLGYLPKAAQDAVAQVLTARGQTTISDPEISEVLRLALREFGGTKKR